VESPGAPGEVNDQSVTKVNSIRHAAVASLLANGEAQTTLGLHKQAAALRGPVRPYDQNPEKRMGRR
jgi:hypothetical protein